MKSFFFIFLIFSTFIDFYSFRNTIDVVTILSSNFVSIEIWSNDWLIFDLVLQCFISLINTFDMNTKSMILWEFLTSQVIVSCERVNFMPASFIISISWFVMTIEVDFQRSVDCFYVEDKRRLLHSICSSVCFLSMCSRFI